MSPDPTDARRDKLRGWRNRQAAQVAANEDVVVEKAKELDPADMSEGAQLIREAAESIQDRRGNRG
jgi:hypothetical protein